MLTAGATDATNKHKRISGEAGIGLSILSYSSWTDTRNSRGNRYDNSFESVATHHDINLNNKKAIHHDLLNVFDGEFESPSEEHGEEPGTYTLLPSLSLKLGVEIKLVPELSIGIKNKLFFTSSDLIDGQQWQERTGETNDNDLVNFLALELCYHLY